VRGRVTTDVLETSKTCSGASLELFPSELSTDPPATTNPGKTVPHSDPREHTLAEAAPVGCDTDPGRPVGYGSEVDSLGSDVAVGSIAWPAVKSNAPFECGTPIELSSCTCTSTDYTVGSTP
jgi:hypothetical protein